MKSKLFILLIFITFENLAKAQITMHKMVEAGYVYQNQSFTELGGKLLFLNNDDFIYRIGAAGMFGESGGKFIALPKLQGDILINTEKNVDFYHSYYFLGGVEITTKYAAPKIGVTLFGLLDFTAGYAFSIDKNGVNGKELKGLNLNFTVNIPTVMIHNLLKK